MIEGCRSLALLRAVGAAVPVGLRLEERVVHEPRDAPGAPLDAVDVPVADAARVRQRVVHAGVHVVRPLAAVMQRTQHHLRVLAARFHDVDLAARGPGTVAVAQRQQPQRWPQPLSFGESRAELDAPVLLREQLAPVVRPRLEARRRVRAAIGAVTRRHVGHGLPPGDDAEHAVLYPHVGGRRGVALQFVVAPAAHVRTAVGVPEAVTLFGRPPGGIKGRVVELVVPGKRPAGAIGITPRRRGRGHGAEAVAPRVAGRDRGTQPRSRNAHRRDAQQRTAAATPSPLTHYLRATGSSRTTGVGLPCASSTAR